MSKKNLKNLNKLATFEIEISDAYETSTVQFSHGQADALNKLMVNFRGDNMGVDLEVIDVDSSLVLALTKAGSTVYLSLLDSLGGDDEDEDECGHDIMEFDGQTWSVPDDMVNFDGFKLEK